MFKKLLVLGTAALISCSTAFGEVVDSGYSAPSTYAQTLPGIETIVLNYDMTGINLTVTGSTTAEKYVGGFVAPGGYRILSGTARIGTETFGAVSDTVIVDLLESPTGTTTLTSMLTSVLAMGTASSPYTFAFTDKVLDKSSTLVINRYGSMTAAESTGWRNLQIALQVQRK